jgi:hypothetical protein
LIDRLQQFAHVVAPRQDVDLPLGSIFHQVLEPRSCLSSLPGVELVVAVLVESLHQRALDFGFVQWSRLQRTAEQQTCSRQDER